MTEIIQHLPNGRKLIIQRDIVADPLTLFQIQAGKYPVCPIFKTDIFKMDYEELKKYCYWKAQNMIISNHKKYLALCKRVNMLSSSGQINQYDWRREHLRLHIKYCVDDEDDILKQEQFWYMAFVKMFEQQLLEYRIKQQHMKPILVRRFTKDLRILSEYTYDYAAHWKACGYSADHWRLRDAKAKIVRLIRR